MDKRLPPLLVAVFINIAGFSLILPLLPFYGQVFQARPFEIALLFAAYMAPSVAGAPLVGRLLPATAQRLGMVVFVVGVTGILVALVTTSVVVMTTATIVASVGQGMGVSASMRALLLGSTAAERPSLMSAIYLACYTGAMVPSIIAGQLSHVLPTVTIAFGYGVLALVATAITLVFARNPSGA